MEGYPNGVIILLLRMLQFVPIWLQVLFLLHLQLTPLQGSFFGRMLFRLIVTGFEPRTCGLQAQGLTIKPRLLLS